MKKTNMKNIPNILTGIRIVFVPLICLFMYIGYIMSCRVLHIFAIVLTFIACITDFFDGQLARKYNIVSSFGRCFDPIADKVLVMSLIIMLIYMKMLWIFPAIIILFREFLISGVREFCAKEKQIVVPVSKLAKYKTATQMFSLFFLMLFGDNCYLCFIGNIIFTISAILSIITAYNYIMSVKDIFFCR